MYEDRVSVAKEAINTELKDYPQHYRLRRVRNLNLPDEELFELAGEDGRICGTASAYFLGAVVVRVKIRTV